MLVMGRMRVTMFVMKQAVCIQLVILFLYRPSTSNHKQAAECRGEEKEVCDGQDIRPYQRGYIGESSLHSRARPGLFSFVWLKLLLGKGRWNKQ